MGASVNKALGPITVGYVQTIKDEGMPLYGESSYGDLFIEYNVVLPKTLTSEMRQSKLGSETFAKPFLRRVFFSRIRLCLSRYKLTYEGRALEEWCRCIYHI